jgi:hypothetical protein
LPPNEYQQFSGTAGPRLRRSFSDIQSIVSTFVDITGFFSVIATFSYSVDTACLFELAQITKELSSTAVIELK